MNSSRMLFRTNTHAWLLSLGLACSLALLLLLGTGTVSAYAPTESDSVVW